MNTAKSQCLLIRADANARIGAGHVMRCLALAQAWRDGGGRVLFALKDGAAGGLEERLIAEGFETRAIDAGPGTPEDALQTIEFSKAAGADWTAVDGYQFGADYQRALKEAGLRVLWLDDYGHAAPYRADVVLNQNISAGEALYVDRSEHTRLLLGCRYALLRREFLRGNDKERVIPERARRVLVTLGGGDPENVTGKVLEALNVLKSEPLDVCVVIGAANPNRAALEAACARSRHRARVEFNSGRMSDLMAEADIAVAAAGSTCWELAFMGLPSALIPLTDNQVPLAEGMAAAGAALNAGRHRDFSVGRLSELLDELLRNRDLRTGFCQRSRELMDGAGLERVMMWMKGERSYLRRVRRGDCRLLWDWANDPEVRSKAFQGDPIPWEDHVRWFNARLDSPNCVIFIGMDSQDIPVGQVRFDIQGREAEIDISVDGKRRGGGFGRWLVEAGTRLFFSCAPAQAVRAVIKKSNVPSQQIFKKSGFSFVGETTCQDVPCVEYKQERSK